MQPTCKFLIIDDDPVNNMVCNFVITENLPQAEVLSSTIPEEGLKILAEKCADGSDCKPPINILLDINMPSMTGWDVLDHLKKLTSDAKQKFVVFMLSSSKDERDVSKATDNPLVAKYFVKPLNKDAIAKILAHNPCANEQ